MKQILKNYCAALRQGTAIVPYTDFAPLEPGVRQAGMLVTRSSGGSAATERHANCANEYLAAKNADRDAIGPWAVQLKHVVHNQTPEGCVMTSKSDTCFTNLFAIPFKSNCDNALNTTNCPGNAADAGQRLLPGQAD